jgi:hypothetical protein
MARVQKHTAVAAREREAVMVVERVELETPVLEVAAVDGRSAATLVKEVRQLRAA